MLTRLTSIALLATAPLCATWSLGIVDPKTKTIAIAAASCSPSVYGVGGVVPGIGFVFAQAASNMRAKNEAMEAMRRGTPLADILKRITSAEFDSDAAEQQYALLTIAEIGKPLTFTGNQTPEWRGVRSSKGISVQGNTLVGANVADAAYQALVQGAWESDAELAGVAMAALAAGSRAGGDRRCGESTASSAFLTVMRASDDPAAPFINLIIRGLRPNSQNAVDLLAGKFREWLQQKR